MRSGNESMKKKNGKIAQNAIYINQMINKQNTNCDEKFLLQRVDDTFNC